MALFLMGVAMRVVFFSCGSGEHELTLTTRVNIPDLKEVEDHTGLSTQDLTCGGSIGSMR